MGSTNISIKQEAYEYLKSIKTADESFSDAILKLRANQKKDGQLAVQIAKNYKKPSKKHVQEREKAIQKFREEFRART